MTKKASLGVVAALCLSAATANATQFDITIKNTTGTAWSAGLLTLQPLLQLGPAPAPGAGGYAAYAFASDACTQADSFCAGAGCEDGQPAVLAQRAGLSVGTDAWLVPALTPGASATVSVQVSAAPSPSSQPRISFLARAGSASDFVAMHRAGDAAALTSAPLFDSAGMATQVVAFEIGGYNAGASDALDGGLGDCTQSCTGAAGCFLAPGNSSTGASPPAQPAQPVLSNPWIYAAPANYTTDGLALGLLGGEGVSGALVMVANGFGFGSSAEWDPSRSGQAHVLTGLAGGAPSAHVFSAEAGHELMGFPTIENLVSDDVPAAGVGHYLVQEFMPLTASSSASVHALGNDSDLPQWTSTGWGYPGFWNMGVTTGDLRTGDGMGGDEVVVPTWTGDLAVLKHDTAETLNTYSFFDTPAGENLYGHVAVADVVAADGNEIIAFGAATGTVYVLSAPAEGGQLHVEWSSLPASGLYAFGSGPAVADLDGDGQPEIIVNSAGSNDVYAYDPSYGRGCKYHWTIAGATTFAFSSPVVGDVDGDGWGDKEVVAFSANALLAVLGVPTAPTDGTTCADGFVKWTHTVGDGGDAWFTPALANLSGNDALDIVVASHTTLEVVDANAQTVAYRFSDPSATFFPSAVVAGRGFGYPQSSPWAYVPPPDPTLPAASIYVSGWDNGKVYHLTTPSDAPIPSQDWLTFMGNNSRTGAR